jgi:Fe-S cluster assembly protein SufD
MTQLMEEKDVYLSEFDRFEKYLAGTERSKVHRLRRKAIDHFATVGFPTLRDEEWRFTSVAPLTRIPFRAAEPAPDGRVREEFAEELQARGAGCRLVFVNGRFAPRLSARDALPDGTLMSLADVFSHQPERVEAYLGRYAGYDQSAFTALNTAFLRDGAFLSLPPGKEIAEPIHLVFISTGADAPAVAHPRNLIVAGRHSRATVVETYLGSAEDVYFTNAVTEIVVGEEAGLDHYKVQREGAQAFHISTQQVQQNRGSRFTSHALNFGGGLVRNDVNAVLDGEGCECTLNGLYLASGRQHVDNHTRIDHARPRCASHELYKGILDGQAHGVFNGKIFVHQDAQKTDAKQTNKTLLLSDQAVINTKPQLEIFADDVKCTHGATVGQLDAEAVFYLRSRGIGAREARDLLTFAFANDIIQRIRPQALRSELDRALLAGRQLPESRVTEEAV